MIAQNRRATYADGSAKMYGKTARPDFRGIEGFEDHNLEALFFWDASGRLSATAINVACPAQEVVPRSTPTSGIPSEKPCGPATART